ncbi:transglycosylase SLT domain-containing protein [Paracoccus pacificus]|uniref:Transglycosylase SLT domain-containing protein n=1 Tax=Paracoccus pacificus TaxID=1463598 RepID=A0ABW4R536_9RHOB
MTDLIQHLASRRRMLGLLFAATALAACEQSPSSGAAKPRPRPTTGLYPNETPELRTKINYYADQYEVPTALVHRVVKRESRYRPGARNGPYYGLMQLLPGTARTMGYRGSAEGLLDADTNLKYGVKYLRGAWMVSDGSYDKAVMWYSRGYYYEAKRRGLLRETGLRA